MSLLLGVVYCAGVVANRAVRREGKKDLADLKEAYKDKIEEVKKEAAVELPAAKGAEAAPDPTAPGATSTSPFPAAPPPPRPASTAAKSTPGLKTLGNFIDLPKTQALPPSEIEMIWRLRHASNPQSLCATVPLATYQTIEAAAKRYPHFVLPVPREGQGAEIHLLQWTFPAPDTATVLFTHLAEFKLRGEFAQPHTVITHHLELAGEKELVLLQGAVMEGRGVSVDEAKWLLMCLQKFYGFGSGSEGRRRLLELFGRGDPAFKVEDLVDEAEKLV